MRARIKRFYKPLIAFIFVSILSIAWTYQFNRTVYALDQDVHFTSGIVYNRLQLDSPRINVIHMAWIDWKNGEYQFELTKPFDFNARYPANTVLDFAKLNDWELAINGDYFQLPEDQSYPDIGDLVQSNGWAVFNGSISIPEKLGYFAKHHSNLVMYEDGSVDFFVDFNDLQIEDRTAYLNRRKIRFAVCGGPILLKDGSIPDIPKGNQNPGPQTAIGFDANKNRIVFVTVDGRQNGVSEGMTCMELATILQSFGITEALAMDGGGSSTMVIQNARENFLLVNKPIHQGLANRMRPVANSVGIRRIQVD